MENVDKRKRLPIFLIISHFIPARHWRCYILDFICGQYCKKEKQINTTINYPRKPLVYVVFGGSCFCGLCNLAPVTSKLTPTEAENRAVRNQSHIFYLLSAQLFYEVACLEDRQIGVVVI